MPRAIFDSGQGRRAILLLSVLALVLVIGSAASLVAYAWFAVNDNEAARETALVRRTVTRTADRIIQDTTTAAAWDEAYDELAKPLDPAWLDRSIATYYHSTFGHDVTLVYGVHGDLAYVASEGVRADQGDWRALSKVVLPLVRQVQKREMRQRAGLAPQGRAEQGGGIAIGASVRSGGQIYLLGISTVAPSTGSARGVRPPSVIVSGRRVDARLLALFSDDLGIDGIRLDTTAPDLAVSAPILSPDGERLGALVWRPARPGAEVLTQAGGYILTALGLLLLATLALAFRISRLFARVQGNDRMLRDTMVELTEARDLAQAANSAKSQFLANMSHEIRTPLNGVLGMAQVLERSELSAEQRDRVRVINSSGKALLAVLNDILDLSKIEAGKLKIETVEFELWDVVSAVYESYHDLAASKGVTLTVELKPELRGTYLGDASRLRQILLNLVSNAVKFAEGGAVELRVERAAAEVTFSVSDHGIGIPANKIAGLFEKFSQVDGTVTRRAGGTGLGLAISRELAGLMGGRMSVESIEGQGSTFSMTLPLTPVVRSADAAPTPAPGFDDEATDAAPLRILAAEDNETNQLVLKALLAPLGAQLVMVANGAEAVEAYRLQAFDIVLMDVQMPVMDGCTATRRIRAMEAERHTPRTPVLALTANAMAHQVEEYAVAGMDGYIAKPIDIERLFGEISAVLEAQEVRGAA
jgi:signal transduction histidine kinase/ActR/RegA family two-component response regulator